jgi:hypothetical protein
MKTWNARICINNTNTDGAFTRAKLYEYWKLGAEIMVDIEGTSLATAENDMPLDLNITDDSVRFFGVAFLHAKQLAESR